MKVLFILLQITVGFIVYHALKNHMNRNVAISLGVMCALVIYVHPIPLLYVTWKHALPKETVTQYILNFGLPYDVGKDRATWNNIAGFDTTWVLDEQIKHTHPIDHIDFVYSTLKIPGIKPEHVCIISQATGSIFIDMLKEEATARCHYLVKNAVSLGFVQDVVDGKITKEQSRDEYGKRILNNIFLDWFKDPLQEAHKTLGEGAHHLIITGSEHKH